MDPHTQAAIDEILQRNRQLVSPKSEKKTIGSKCGVRMKNITLTESNHVHAYHGRSKDPEPRSVEISEIFIDFVFVFAVYVLNCQFVVSQDDEDEHPSINFEEYFNYFAVIFLIWKDLMTYQSLFDNNDVIHRVFNVFIGSGVIGLALNIRGGWDAEDNLSMFCWFAFGIDMLYMILYLRVYFNIKDTVAASVNPERELYRELICIADVTRRQMWFIIQALIWVLGALNTKRSLGRTRIFMWVAVGLYFVYDFGTGFCFAMEKICHPHTNHYSERMNSFALIVVGVAVLGLFTEDPTWEDYYYVALAFFVIFGIKMLIFDRDAIMQDEHALTQGYWRRMCWIYSQLFMTAGGALIGGSIAMLTNAMTDDYFDDAHLMYSNGFGALIFFNWVGRTCHKFKHRTDSCNPLLALYCIEMVLQFVIAILAFMMPYFLVKYPVDQISDGAPFLYSICALFFLVVIGLIPEFTQHCGCACCKPELFEYEEIPYENQPLLTKPKGTNTVNPSSV